MVVASLHLFLLMIARPFRGAVVSEVSRACEVQRKSASRRTAVFDTSPGRSLRAVTMASSADQDIPGSLVVRERVRPLSVLLGHR